MRRMMEYSYGTNGGQDLNTMTAFLGQQDRSSPFGVIAWSLFFIWVGFAWLMSISLGWVLLGVGVLLLAMQIARHVYDVKADGFWILVGSAFLVGAALELLGAQMPLLPVVLIAAGIGQLVCCRA